MSFVAKAQEEDLVEALACENSEDEDALETKNSGTSASFEAAAKALDSGESGAAGLETKANSAFKFAEDADLESLEFDEDEDEISDPKESSSDDSKPLNPSPLQLLYVQQCINHSSLQTQQKTEFKLKIPMSTSEEERELASKAFKLGTVQKHGLSAKAVIFTPPNPQLLSPTAIPDIRQHFLVPVVVVDPLSQFNHPLICPNCGMSEQTLKRFHSTARVVYTPRHYFLAIDRQYQCKCKKLFYALNKQAYEALPSFIRSAYDIVVHSETMFVDTHLEELLEGFSFTMGGAKISRLLRECRAQRWITTIQDFASRLSAYASRSLSQTLDAKKFLPDAQMTDYENPRGYNGRWNVISSAWINNRFKHSTMKHADFMRKYMSTITGHFLCMDSSFKVTGKMRVSLGELSAKPFSQLFLVVNEYSQVLLYQLLPDGTNELLAGGLQTLTHRYDSRNEPAPRYLAGDRGRTGDLPLFDLFTFKNPPEDPKKICSIPQSHPSFWRSGSSDSTPPVSASPPHPSTRPSLGSPSATLSPSPSLPSIGQSNPLPTASASSLPADHLAGSCARLLSPSVSTAAHLVGPSPPSATCSSSASPNSALSPLSAPGSSSSASSSSAASSSYSSSASSCSSSSPPVSDSLGKYGQVADVDGRHRPQGGLDFPHSDRRLQILGDKESKVYTQFVNRCSAAFLDVAHPYQYAGSEKMCRLRPVRELMNALDGLQDWVAAGKHVVKSLSEFKKAISYAKMDVELGLLLDPDPWFIVTNSGQVVLTRNTQRVESVHSVLKREFNNIHCGPQRGDLLLLRLFHERNVLQAYRHKLLPMFGTVALWRLYEANRLGGAVFGPTFRFFTLPDLPEKADPLGIGPPQNEVVPELSTKGHALLAATSIKIASNPATRLKVMNLFQRSGVCAPPVVTTASPSTGPAAVASAPHASASAAALATPASATSGTGATSQSLSVPSLVSVSMKGKKRPMTPQHDGGPLTTAVSTSVPSTSSSPLPSTPSLSESVPQLPPSTKPHKKVRGKKSQLPKSVSQEQFMAGHTMQVIGYSNFEKTAMTMLTGVHQAATEQDTAQKFNSFYDDWMRGCAQSANGPPAERLYPRSRQELLKQMKQMQAYRGGSSIALQMEQKAAAARPPDNPLPLQEVHCNQCRAAHLPRAACPAVSAETIAQANALFLSGQELLLNSPDHLFSDAVSYQSAPSSSLPSTHPNFSSSTQPSSSSSSSFSFQPASSPTSSSSAQPSSCSTSSALASRSSLPGSIFQSTALTPAMLDIDPGAGTRTRYSDFEVQTLDNLVAKRTTPDIGWQSIAEEWETLRVDFDIINDPRQKLRRRTAESLRAKYKDTSTDARSLKRPCGSSSSNSNPQQAPSDSAASSKRQKTPSTPASAPAPSHPQPTLPQPSLLPHPHQSHGVSSVRLPQLSLGLNISAQPSHPSSSPPSSSLLGSILHHAESFPVDSDEYFAYMSQANLLIPGATPGNPARTASPQQPTAHHPTASPLASSSMGTPSHSVSTPLNNPDSPTHSSAMTVSAQSADIRRFFPSSSRPQHPKLPQAPSSDKQAVKLTRKLSNAEKLQFMRHYNALDHKDDPNFFRKKFMHSFIIKNWSPPNAVPSGDSLKTVLAPALQDGQAKMHECCTSSTNDEQLLGVAKRICSELSKKSQFAPCAAHLVFLFKTNNSLE